MPRNPVTKRAKSRARIPLKMRVKVWERDGGVCHYCGKKLPRPGGRGSRVSQVDHVVAQSQGGKDILSNLVISCKTCNRAKANLDYGAFLLSELKKTVTKLRMIRRNLRELKSRG